MIGRILVFTVAIIVSGSDRPKRNSVRDELEKLQGTWRAVRLEADGQTGPKEVTRKVKWIFKGNDYTGVSPEMDFKGKFTIRPARTPKEMDLAPKGSKEAMAAIYKLGGDNLTICIAGFASRDPQQRKKRPTDFVTKEGDGRALYVLKREKSAKKGN